MKTEHFPSLELCKKLTEIGFIRNRRWQEDMLYFREDEEDEYELISKDSYDNSYGNDFVDAFSVMEMLDVMPDRIKFSYFLRISRLITGQIKVEYRKTEGIDIVFASSDIDSLPNALAEMILWLVDNGYINFNEVE